MLIIGVKAALWKWHYNVDSSEDIRKILPLRISTKSQKWLASSNIHFYFENHGVLFQARFHYKQIYNSTWKLSINACNILHSSTTWLSIAMNIYQNVSFLLFHKKNTIIYNLFLVNEERIKLNNVLKLIQIRRNSVSFTICQCTNYENFKVIYWSRNLFSINYYYYKLCRILSSYYLFYLEFNSNI